MTPSERQNKAAKEIGYNAIFLRRLGDKVLVQVEYKGYWRTVIEEFFDSNFSHIVEPTGIKEIMNHSDSYKIKLKLEHKDK